MSKLVKQTELELKEKIMDALGRAVADGVLDEAPLPAFIIEVPKERQNGDYSTNVAMAGAKAFHKAPRVIAQAIVDRLDLADTVFDRAEIAGPGFINFFLGNRFYAAVLEDLMAHEHIAVRRAVAAQIPLPSGNGQTRAIGAGTQNLRLRLIPAQAHLHINRLLRRLLLLRVAKHQRLRLRLQRTHGGQLNLVAVAVQPLGAHDLQYHIPGVRLLLRHTAPRSSA